VCGKIQVRRRHGFTLIELLVVIAIIVILIGMLLPAIQKVRESASRMKCQNNLKQMGLAIYSFENTYQRFPWGTMDPIDAQSSGRRSGLMTWMYSILPFAEQQNLYNNLQWVSIPLYYCPSEPRSYSQLYYYGCTDYVGIEGLDYGDGLGIINATDGFWYGTSVRVTDVTDGNSNTVMLGERPSSADKSWGHWYSSGDKDSVSGVAITFTWDLLTFYQNPQGQPCPAPPHYFGAGPNNINDNCSFDYMWSNHIGGANFTMGDGSVRFISYSVSTTTIKALATRAGGEVVEVP
jgi:prepilin-type N-terminal cleavage/methylation domain-containing protein/prepilin-type processing-associated H-X9-DG protein